MFRIQNSLRRLSIKTGVRNFNNFLKLSDRIINKAHIKEITHIHAYETDIIKTPVPAHFIIKMTGEKIDGFGTWMFGWVNSYHREITICSEKNPKDYEILKKEWYG